MISESKFQIGKNGVNEGTINALNNSLKNYKQLRITLLKSATRDRNEIIKIAKEIISKTDYQCRYKIIGFKIILRRRSAKKKRYK